MRKLFITCLLWPMPLIAGACPNSTNNPTMPGTVTTCFYIDYVSGNDTNSGATEVLAWQHPPSAANATSVAAAHTPAADEGWIFKGGVHVGSGTYPMNVPWGGTSGHPDYMGYDLSWYTGGAWARPIFDGGGVS